MAASNDTENRDRRERNSSLADGEESVRPPNILTSSHLPFLRDLLSDKKITGFSILQYTPKISKNQSEINTIRKLTYYISLDTFVRWLLKCQNDTNIIF